MKNLLVIGGTGFIGYHVIKEAKKRGFRVYSISLNLPKKLRLNKGVKYLKVDITNYQQLKKKLNVNFSYVINAGGYGTHPDFGKEGDKLIKNHFFGLVNIIQVLNLKSIKKFIQIGSSLEYGKKKSPLKEIYKCNPNTPYSIAKFLSTTLLINLSKKKMLPTTVLRLFQVYGPKQDSNRIIPFLIKNCIKNRKFRTTKGLQLCDFCHIEDVIRAIFKALNTKSKNGEIINIGSGKPIKIKNLIQLIIKLIGKGKPIIGALNYKKETNMKNYPNIQKAKRILNWRPLINIKHGIEKTILSYK